MTLGFRCFLFGEEFWEILSGQADDVAAERPVDSHAGSIEFPDGLRMWHKGTIEVLQITYIPCSASFMMQERFVLYIPFVVNT